MTTIATHRRTITARVYQGFVSRFYAIAALAHHSRPARTHRPVIFDLDERTLRDIGMSRSEFMAGDIDG